MPKKLIYFADKLKLPPEILTQKSTFLGGNGSGKSYAIDVIIEQALELGAWMIIVDPVGIHYGIRLSMKGDEPSGFNIPVFGGLHGDLPLTPESGTLIADLLFERRLSAILDVSQFETDADLNRFITAFGKQFFKRMKTKRQAVTIVLEEAQEIIPQNPQEGEKQKLHVWQAIGKIGRNYGIGLMMASPRPQEIAKKVLNLTQNMFVFQMTGTHERKALDEWCSYISLDTKLSNVVPTLDVGQCLAISPRTLNEFGLKVKVHSKITYDASATPDWSDKAETVELTPIDIAELSEKMTALIEEAKENDPTYLKRQISKLEKQLRGLERDIPAPEPTVKYQTVPMVSKEDIERMERLHSQWVEVLQSDLAKANTAWIEAIRDLEARTASQDAILAAAQSTQPAPRTKPVRAPQEAVGVTFHKPNNGKAPAAETIKLGNGEQVTLAALMQYGALTKSQLRILTTYKKSSVDTFIRHLRQAGLLVESDTGLFRPSDIAWELFPNYEPLPEGKELVKHWKENLPQGERVIFEHLLQAPRIFVPRSKLQEATGYAKSSVDTYLKFMRTRNLIEDRGSVRIHPDFWEHL